MNIETLKNGHYRIRQYSNGKRYSVSFDHKPTMKEITLALAEKMGIEPSNCAQIGTIESYAMKLLEMKRKQGKSTTTLRGYTSIINNTPTWFLSRQIAEITNKDCQKLIDEYGASHSPKSTRLLWSFYHSILAEYRAEFTPSIKLPPITKKAVYEPSTQDIQAIIEASEGSRYEIPFKLAMLGLRRGEVCALQITDLDDNNILTINKDMVLDESNKYYIKPSPKTEASNRRILLPSSVADRIREQGFIFNGNPHTINEALHKYQDQLNIPRFKLHMMRHFAAAFLHQQGFSDSAILEYCGFEENSDVMKRVYRYNLDPEKRQEDIANKFDSLL